MNAPAPRPVLPGRPLPAHGRFDYVPLKGRPDYSWPGGKRLAVWVALSRSGWIKPGYLPTPGELGATLVELVRQGYQGKPLWEHVGISLFRTFSGFALGALLGVPLGLLTNAVQSLAGVLLPSATVFLLLLCNDKAVLGPWTNGRAMNIFTGGVVAVLVASKLQPRVLQRCVFAHRSGEQGHSRMLEHLHAQALLDLGLRLGEGSGAALAWPLLVSACAILSDMASFESAGVSRQDAASNPSNSV